MVAAAHATARASPIRADSRSIAFMDFKNGVAFARSASHSASKAAVSVVSSMGAMRWGRVWCAPWRPIGGQRATV